MRKLLDVGAPVANIQGHISAAFGKQTALLICYSFRAVQCYSLFVKLFANRILLRPVSVPAFRQFCPSFPPCLEATIIIISYCIRDA